MNRDSQLGGYNQNNLSKSGSQAKIGGLSRNNVNAKSLDGLEPIMKGGKNVESLKTIPDPIHESPRKMNLSKIESKNTL